MVLMVRVRRGGRVGCGVPEGEAARINGKVNQEDTDGAVFEQPQRKLRRNERAQIVHLERAAV